MIASWAYHQLCHCSHCSRSSRRPCRGPRIALGVTGRSSSVLGGFWSLRLPGGCSCWRPRDSGHHILAGHLIVEVAEDVATGARQRPGAIDKVVAGIIGGVSIDDARAGVEPSRMPFTCMVFITGVAGLIIVDVVGLVVRLDAGLGGETYSSQHRQQGRCPEQVPPRAHLAGGGKRDRGSRLA
ncbi:hypothetical protein PVAP13_2KG035232 [Panicum virgatum]|uniref:Uncharacterized protein n=1 Tax=Panicum virgatum TaxID=38727 RepID=A0A8T0VUX1_PANVG|nr:hypothetical protein PVAP13_2KG035232 [Panicum virgatum]